jgi:hypothetical protein
MGLLSLSGLFQEPGQTGQRLDEKPLRQSFLAQEDRPVGFFRGGVRLAPAATMKSWDRRRESIHGEKSASLRTNVPSVEE